MLQQLLRGLLALAVPISLFAQSTPKATQDKAAGDIYKAAGPSVVLIEVYGDDGKVSGSGSGFLVSGDGQILTNFHVIEHSKRATVTLANGDAYDSVGVLDVDKRKDIALLKIKAVSMPYLKLGHSTSAQIGDKLYTLGNPLGVFQNTLSDGILSGIRQMEGYKVFQLSAPISHGSSGSPVFNVQGEVIGIVEATLPQGQNLNFAIPIDYAAGMLDSREIQPLAAYYEPEEKEKEEAARKSAPSTVAKEPTSAASPSEAIKKDAFDYLGSKVGVWTAQDAEVELGKPVDRRDAILNNAVTGDIFRYPSPVPNLSTIELNINRATKKLGAVYFYYANTVSWKSLEATLGKNYKKIKMQNGRPGYLYQFQNRQLMVIVDSGNNVYNVGIW
jgi:S1-C subfamily serine protease